MTFEPSTMLTTSTSGNRLTAVSVLVVVGASVDGVVVASDDAVLSDDAVVAEESEVSAVDDVVESDDVAVRAVVGAVEAASATVVSLDAVGVSSAGVTADSSVAADTEAAVDSSALSSVVVPPQAAKTKARPVATASDQSELPLCDRFLGSRCVAS